MNNFKTFEDYTVFGAAKTRDRRGSVPSTGYDMKPIAIHVKELVGAAVKQAKIYEDDDEKSHSAEEYIKEACKHLEETLLKEWKKDKS